MASSCNFNKSSYHQASKQNVLLVLWYIAFGAIHELSHLVIAITLGYSHGIFDVGAARFFHGILLGRQCILPSLDAESVSFLWVRHAGWMISLSLAILIPRRHRNVKLAAIITAVEAIWTDLLQLPVLNGITMTSSTTANSIFFCGNFGILLLHHLWLKNQGQSALDCLEQMVKVTMMRGAQSGGVVTFYPQKSDQKLLVASRCRVVNGKRTDLSKLIRTKLQRDMFMMRRKPFPSDFVVTMSGHTRFATSSKASLDGTHPHQWTPATSRKMYDWHVKHNQAQQGHEHTPETIKVENYITHNGDFDFYVVNGKTYDLSVLQPWLVAVTGCQMPSSVDSCAVAGMIDLLRTQGCFGLSARFAICLGLESSCIQDDLTDFPPYKHFEQIGELFEQVLGEMLKTTSMDNIGDSEEIRHSFALRVFTKLEARHETLVKPLSRYITDSEDGGSSLLAFCLVTINAFFDNDLFMTTKTFLKNAKGSFGLCVTSSLDAHRQICLAARGQTVSCF